MATKLLIADDHLVWRQGLRSLLEPDFQVVAEAHDGREAVAKSLAFQPDIVILDVRLPDMNGLVVARQIRRSLPSIRLLILSAAADEDVIAEARAAGVDAYLRKEESPEIIVDTVRSMAAGEPRTKTTRCTTVHPGSAIASPENKDAAVQLSERELTVLRLMARGLRHKQIATKLSISPRTVGNYVASIYNKLGVNGRGEAVVYAIKSGIVRV